MVKETTCETCMHKGVCKNKEDFEEYVKYAREHDNNNDLALPRDFVRVAIMCTGYDPNIVARRVNGYRPEFMLFDEGVNIPIICKPVVPHDDFKKYSDYLDDGIDNPCTIPHKEPVESIESKEERMNRLSLKKAIDKERKREAYSGASSGFSLCETELKKD